MLYVINFMNLCLAGWIFHQKFNNILPPLLIFSPRCPLFTSIIPKCSGIYPLFGKIFIPAHPILRQSSSTVCLSNWESYADLFYDFYKIRIFLYWRLYLFYTWDSAANLWRWWSLVIMTVHTVNKAGSYASVQFSPLFLLSTLCKSGTELS